MSIKLALLTTTRVVAMARYWECLACGNSDPEKFTAVIDRRQGMSHAVVTWQGWRCLKCNSLCREPDDDWGSLGHL